MARYQKLALATLSLGFLLVVLGGVVRVSGAGSACGTDWPTCNGDLIPTSWTTDTVIAFSHRVLTAVGAVLTLALAALGWRLRSERQSLFVLPLAAVMLLAAQIALGGATVSTGRPALLVTAHLGLAELYVGTLLTLTVVAFAPELARALGRPVGGHLTRLGRLALGAALAVFALTMTGSYLAVSGDSLACSDWPLCNGRLIPSGWTAVDIHLVHQLVAAAATLLVVAVGVLVRRIRSDSQLIIALATATSVLMVVQIFVGAVSVWANRDPLVSVAHLSVAVVILGMLVAVVVLDRLIPVGAAVWRPAAPVTMRQRLSDYVTLTKPGVMVLLLVTTFCGMLVAERGMPSWSLVWWTLLGGALSAGGAAAMNHYMDRDIDAIMTRTRTRPVPSGRIPAVHVPVFGFTLTVLAVYILTVFVNPLAAVLSLSGNLFYVLVYTKVLKRSTPQNIVIGGAAGAMPPMVGWAAVTGNVALPALLMFAIVFYWTPPHFWSLALYKSGDYAAAHVPMFPEVYGPAETRRHIFLYTVMLVVTSLFFFPLRVMGLFYLVAALIFGGIFLYKAYQLTHRPEAQEQLARSLFFYSIQYLGLLFAAMVIDRVWF